VGVASYRLHGLDGEHVLRSADEALYLAKQAGRDRVAGADRPRSLGPVAPLPTFRAIPPRTDPATANPVTQPPSLPM
jgi:hypothetical protein